MAECVLWKVWHFAAFLYHYVVACVLAFRHVVVRYIWNGAELGNKVFLGLCLSLFQCLVSFLYCCNLSLYFVGLLLVALLHESTNLSCHLLGF